MVKLTQPDGVPNFCFVLVGTTDVSMTKMKGSDVVDERPLRRARWPRNQLEMKSYSLLIQTDWDYPGTASTFGWSIRSVQKRKKRCDHGGTDGTIVCPDCGITHIEFINSAFDFLTNNIGAIADDPGYFN